jgi:hypothetical protein
VKTRENELGVSSRGTVKDRRQSAQTGELARNGKFMKAPGFLPARRDDLLEHSF